jgi:nucleoside 2-deoxyribosyltransferase
LPVIFGDDKKKAALASHIIRKSSTPTYRPFFQRKSLENLVKTTTLPSPGAAADSLILLIGRELEGTPGTDVLGEGKKLCAQIGTVSYEDVQWIADQLIKSGILEGMSYHGDGFLAKLTFDGWRRFQELQREATKSSVAFFARRFQNPDLDQLFEKCLAPAVKATGYDLNVVTQKAGHIDAIVESEIRSCKFLLADLSDNNEGAYWEAGFAEGLGKPVIYICKEGIKTHFDTEHRHTIRWSLKTLQHTAARVKAVIRNTLLSEAKQTDD